MKNKHDNIKFPVTYPNFSQDKKKYKYKMWAHKDKYLNSKYHLIPFCHPFLPL